MARYWHSAMIGVLLLTPALARAQTAGDDGLSSLAAALRPLLISAMPPVLYEKEHDWGRTADTLSGLHWHGIRPRVTKSPRNHGAWRKMRVSAVDLPRTLELQLSDLRNVTADRQTFKVFLAFQTNVDYEQQNWEHGVRLYSSSVEARLRIKLALECESTLRVEEAGTLLPDLVFRLRVIKSDVSYDNLVVEHIAGIGGSGARLLGEAVRSSLKQLKPSLERDLLERANHAIVRAADTREVRLGLSGLSRKSR